MHFAFLMRINSEEAACGGSASSSAASSSASASAASSSASITFEGIERELPAAVTNLDVNGAKLSICHAVAEKEGAFFNVIAMGATQDEVVKAFESFAAVTE